MVRSLIVGRRAEAPADARLELDALQERVEGEVEVGPRLLAVRDDVEPRTNLILNCGRDRISSQLREVVLAQLVAVLVGELGPPRQRIAADDGRQNRLV